jgi:hypothetical protein
MGGWQVVVCRHEHPGSFGEMLSEGREELGVLRVAELEF